MHQTLKEIEPITDLVAHQTHGMALAHIFGFFRKFAENPLDISTDILLRTAFNQTLGISAILQVSQQIAQII